MRIAAAALFFALGADSFQPSGLSRWSGTQLGIGGIPEHLPPMHIPPLAKIPPFQPRVSLSDMKIPDIDWKSADAQAALNEAGRLLRERSDVFSSKIGEFAYRDPEISVSFPFEKLEASLKAATRLSEYSSLKDLLDAMNMNELGGYYAAAVIFVLLVVGKSQNKNSFVARVPLTPVSSSNIQALTDQVAQLKEATASLEEEISALRDEKATVDAELSSMKGEVESLLGLVKAAQSNEDELRTALKVAQGNYDVEVGALRQQLGEAKAKLPKPHFVETKKKVEVIEPKQIFPFAQYEAPPVAEPSPKVQDPVAKAPEPAPKAAKVAKKATVEAATAPTKKAKKASKKVGKKSKKAVVEKLEDPVDDWSSLSLSTLKRKTVRDLKDYLEAKGATAIDAEGKPLKKDQLVEVVLSM